MVGSLIVAAYYAIPAGVALTAGQMAIAFAINFAVSTLISRSFAPDSSAN